MKYNMDKEDKDYWTFGAIVMFLECGFLSLLCSVWMFFSVGRADFDESWASLIFCLVSCLVFFVLFLFFKYVVKEDEVEVIRMIPYFSGDKWDKKKL